MYCGDETGAFVGDVGMDTCRFGYGGEDAPKVVIPSFVPTRCSLLHRRSDNKEDVKSVYNIPMECTTDPSVWKAQYLERNRIENWNLWQEVWEYAMDTLRVKDAHKHTSASSTQHPILAIARSSSSQKEQMMEVIMEAFDAPACFIAPTPMLISFAFGRQTALVVDIGHAGTTVTPIIDGICLYHSQRSNGRGGGWLDHVQQHVVQTSFQPSLRPRYQIKKEEQNKQPNKFPVFHQLAMHQLMYEMKTNPYVSLSEDDSNTVPFLTCNINSPSTTATEEGGGSHSDDEDSNSAPEFYELPDGTCIDLQSTTTGADLKRLPDLFFASKLPSFCCKNSSDNSVVDSNVVELIRQSLSAVHVDARKELAGNIILSGASSLYPNLATRLSAELSQKLPSLYKYRVIASRNSIERRYAPWIGASVLTSLGSFQQLWLSKAEYAEFGPGIASKRFP